MPQFPFAPRVFFFLAVSVLFCFPNAGERAKFFSPDPAPTAPSASAPAPPAQDESTKLDAAKTPNAQQPSENSELVSQDSPPTFKVRVNLVLVRVVVRDNKGKVVPNLRREDFQLFDNRKPQAITYFSTETPESQALKPAATLAANDEKQPQRPKKHRPPLRNYRSGLSACCSMTCTCPCRTPPWCAMPPQDYSEPSRIPIALLCSAPRDNSTKPSPPTMNCSLNLCIPSCLVPPSAALDSTTVPTCPTIKPTSFKIRVTRKLWP